MKTGKAASWTFWNGEIIAASKQVGEEVILCQRVSTLDGKGIPDDCKTSAVVPIYFTKEKEMFWTAILTEKRNYLSMVQKLLKESGKRLQLNYSGIERNVIWFHAKKRNDGCLVHSEKITSTEGRELYLWFVDLEKAFDRVSSKVVE